MPWLFFTFNRNFNQSAKKEERGGSVKFNGRAFSSNACHENDSSLQRIRVYPKMIVQSNSVYVHTRTRAENPVFNFALLLSIRVYVQTRGDRLETSWTWNETLVNSFHRIHWCPLTPLFQLIIPRSICTFSLLNFVSLSLHRLKLRLQRNNRAVAKRNEADKSFKRVKNVSVEWKIEEDRFFVSKRNEFGRDYEAKLLRLWSEFRVPFWNNWHDLANEQ